MFYSIFTVFLLYKNNLGNFKKINKILPTLNSCTEGRTGHTVPVLCKVQLW